MIFEGLRCLVYDVTLEEVVFVRIDGLNKKGGG